MDRVGETGVAVPDTSEAPAKIEGRYLYCIADSGERADLGPIGIQDSQVNTIPFRDICAVVHTCPAEAYQSADDEVVKEWVLIHQKVVDAAWERWGTVIPLSFDTIVNGQMAQDAEEKVRDWLEEEYPSLKAKMGRIRGAAEYGVQISWDPALIARSLTETNQELARLDAEMRSKPRGAAYMYKEKLASLLKKEMEAKADECFKDFYRRIMVHVDAIVVEKTKKADGDKQMIMNLSCLVNKGRVAALGEELGRINGREEFFVRFTGPWPPYSFVGG